MTKVRLHKPNDPKEAAAVLSLLEEAGCEVVELDDPDAAIEPVGEDSAGVDACPPLVVLLPQDGIADVEFEKAVLTAVQGGCRVIGLWPGDGSGGVPACFDDYGGDTVPWNPERLGRAASGQPQHRTANDAEADMPDTDRHVCK